MRQENERPNQQGKKDHKGSMGGGMDQKSGSSGTKKSGSDDAGSCGSSTGSCGSGSNKGSCG